jgi:hypothetical protein
MIAYQWTSAAIGLGIAALIVFLIRRDQLHNRYAVWWLPVALIIGILGIAPTLVDLLGETLGVSYPPILPMIVAILVLIVKVLLMDIHASRRETDLQRLAQRLAILELELAADRTDPAA